MAWEPGECILADKSIIWWTGQGDVHLVYIPRKPNLKGIELKTLYCWDSSIILNVDGVVGKELDHALYYVQQCGRPSTAATLCRTRANVTIDASVAQLVYNPVKCIKCYLICLREHVVPMMWKEWATR